LPDDHYGEDDYGYDGEDDEWSETDDDAGSSDISDEDEPVACTGPECRMCLKGGEAEGPANEFYDRAWLEDDADDTSDQMPDGLAQKALLRILGDPKGLENAFIGDDEEDEDTRRLLGREMDTQMDLVETQMSLSTLANDTSAESRCDMDKGKKPLLAISEFSHDSLFMNF
jgi:hypothetical protein